MLTRLLPFEFAEKAKSLRRFRARVVRIDGVARNSQASLSMLYVGSGSNLPFILHAAFEFRGRERELAACNIWRAGRLAAAHAQDVDVVVVDVPWPYDVEFADEQYLLEAPSWVRQSLEFVGDWDAILGRLPRSVRGKQLRRIRKHGLTSATTRETADIAAFHANMYVPHTRRRYGASASIASVANVTRCARNGKLLQIVREGEVIAATVLREKGPVLQSLYNGFAGADFSELVGVSAALYYYSIKYAFDHGYREIDFGGSRPLLNDGVFEMKRRWGAQVHDDWSLETLLVRFNRFSDGVRALLCHSPWIARVDSMLVGKSVVDEVPVTAATVARSLRCLASPGLDCLHIHALAGAEDSAYAAAAASAVPVKVIDLRHSDDPLAVYCDS